MLKKILDYLIRQSLERRPAVVGIVIAIIGMGLYAFQNMSMQAYPDFTDPLVRIITIVPGKGAEEMERLITTPLEKELNGIPGETTLRSLSIFGISVVKVIFQDGTPSQLARQQVLERLSRINFPEGVQPQLDPDSSPIGEIYRYTLESPYYNEMSLKAIQEWQLEKYFHQIPGVIDVTTFGGPTKTYQINLDQGRLKAYKLSVSQVYEAISKANDTTGGSYINNNGQAFVVRSLGLIQDTADLGDVVVATSPDGTPVRVKDIADVTIGPATRLGKVGKNGNDDVVQGIALMRRGEDPAKVIQRVYAKLPDIQARLPKGVKLVPLYDRMELIRRTLDTVAHNVVMGVLLVLLVLWVFMGEIGSAFLATTVIPLALLIAFTLLYLCKIPANLLSMGAVDFGIIVDGTVVMVENILRHLAEEGQQASVKERIILIGHSATQAGIPIFFATVIIALGFLPIFSFDGVAGKLFHPLGFTMVFALIGAVLVTMFVIPVLASFFMTKKPVHEGKSPVYSFLYHRYRAVLNQVLRHPWITIGATTGLLVVSLLVMPMLGSEFLPTLDEGNIWLRVTILPNSVSIEQADVIAHQVRERMMKYPEVKNVSSQIGSTDDGTDANPPSNLEFLVDLLPAAQWRPQWGGNKEELVDAMDKDLEAIPGTIRTFSQAIQDNVDEAISGAKGELAIKLYGNDLETLQHLGDQIAAVVSKVPGMVSVADDQVIGQPQYRIAVERQKADRYGVNVEDINKTIEIAVGGKAATQIYEQEKRFDAVVRLQKPYRDTLAMLTDLLVTTPSGKMIPLSEVANVQTVIGATNILHMESQRLITIRANVRDRDLGGTVQDAQERIAKQIKLPDGYHMVWGGQFENQQRANGKMSMVIPLTLVLFFIILMATFGRKRDAWICLLPVPLAIIGAIWSLLLTHTYFSVSAGVGLVAAIGVSVQNGIILVSEIRRNRLAGVHKLKAILKASAMKLRPVLMASLVAMLGLLPAAVSNGIGSQSQRPFAIVIIGSLFVATTISIFIIPLLYCLVDNDEICLMPTAARKRRFIKKDFD